MRYLAAFTVAAWLGLALTPTVQAQPNDPAGVMEAFRAAMNRQELNAALALFADDATVTTPSGSRYVGTERIGAYLRQLIALNYHSTVDPQNVQVQGDRTFSIAQIGLDDWRAIGLPFLDSTADAVVRGGKIQSLDALLTPESARILQRVMDRANPVIDLSAREEFTTNGDSIKARVGNGPVDDEALAKKRHGKSKD